MSAYYMMIKDTGQLTTVRFKKHKVAYTVAAFVSLALAVLFYFIFRSDSTILGSFFLLAGILLSVYCFWNAISNTVVLELSKEGIKYKQYFYSWDALQSYTIRVQDDGESSSFTFLVLNLKNSKVPLEIQLDWIDDEKSVRHYMAVFAKVFLIE